MPDAKISDLSDGAPAQSSDEFVIARGTTNHKLSYVDITSGASSSLSGAGAVTVATNGNTISIGAPSQTVQTQNLVALTLDGNTAGALALASSGTVTLAGGNNITLSQAGNAITISGANAGGAQTAISGVVASDATYTSGTVTFTGVGGGVTVNSNTGQRIDISVAAQSVQPETQTFIAGVSASDTLYTSGNVRITGVGGGITVSSNTGQRIDLSVAAQSVQPETQTFIAGISASDTLYTSGNVRITGVGGGVTVSSNTGQRVDISVAAPVAQTNQAGSVYAISNTSGTSSGTYDARTLSIAGAGMITVAASNSGWRINATQSVQPETQTFLGGIQNSQTTYTSGTVNLSVVAGNLTIRSTTGQAFQFSMSQTPQTGISGIANSQTTYTSGTVSLSELGAITIRSTTGNQFQLSVNAQTTQTQGILSAGVSTGGNTAGNTQVSTGSRLVIVGSNGITASQGTAAGATTITLSGVTQTVQTAGIPALGVSTGGNTSGDTGVNSGTRMVLVGGNNITLSQGTAANATTITISAGAGGAGLSAGMSTNGNTAGDTGFASQRLALIGGNNITLSGSTNGGSMSITVSAPNLGAGAMSAGVSTGGNTAGATGITGTQLVLVGSGVMSLSQTTGANGGTVSFLAPATSSLSATGIVSLSTNGSTISVGAPAYSGGMSTMGNTSGDTGYASQRLNLIGGDNITLSGSTNGGSMSITVSAAAGGAGPALEFWDNMVPGASTAIVNPNASLMIKPLNPANAGFPGNMSVSSVFFDVSGTVSTAAGFTRSLSLGFYTLANSTQLSLLYSASTSWGTNAGNMNINDSMAGRRWVTIHSSQFNAAPNFAAGSDYYFALWDRSSGGSQTFTFLGQLLPYHTGIRSGMMGAASATNTTLGQYPFLGVFATSFSTAMPDSIAASDVNKSVATAVSLQRVIFNNIQSNIL